jgi:pyruvate carboxylase
MMANGRRDVFFESLGLPRIVEVVDRRSRAASAIELRQKADIAEIGSVGAPMGGEVIEVMVEPGTEVMPGQALVVMSAMKMETTVSAPAPGKVTHVAVAKGDRIDAADLLVSINVNDALLEQLDSLGSIDIP